MGFGRFIGGVMLGILAVLVAILAFAVMLGFVKQISTDYNILLGIGLLIAALLMLAYGWYSYRSAKPRGTINVHNE